MLRNSCFAQRVVIFLMVSLIGQVVFGQNANAQHSGHHHHPESAIGSHSNANAQTISKYSSSVSYIDAVHAHHHHHNQQPITTPSEPTDSQTGKDKDCCGDNCECDLAHCSTVYALANTDLYFHPKQTDVFRSEIQKQPANIQTARYRPPIRTNV